MKMKFALTALVTAVALAGCAKAKDEADKKVAESEFKGNWAGPCDSAGFVSSIAGINSSRVLVNVTSDMQRSVELYSDNACATRIGNATYAGTEIIGGASVAGEGARILDLNYTGVSVQIDNDTAVSFANTFQTCGINDWAKGVAREVTAHAGDVNCAFTMKPGTVFDIVQLDGQTLHFGLADATHDKTTEAMRPVVIDKGVSYTKQ